jgi:uncharacterized membrane protein YgcG
MSLVFIWISLGRECTLSLTRSRHAGYCIVLYVRCRHELVVWLAEHAVSLGAEEVRVGRLPFEGKNQVVYTVPTVDGTAMAKCEQQSIPSGGSSSGSSGSSSSGSNSSSSSSSGNSSNGGGGRRREEGCLEAEAEADAESSRGRKVSKVES